MAYGPYGEDYNGSGTQDLMFTGQNTDTVSGTWSSNLSDFMFREYRPAHGRWTSPEPLGLGAVDPANPQSWNRYAYVMNNPMNLVDPLGLYCVWDDGSNDETGDPDTGTPAQCGGQGGTWVPDNGTFTNYNPPPDWTFYSRSSASAPPPDLLVAFPATDANNGNSWWGAFASNLFSWKNFAAEFKDGGCVAVFMDEMSGSAASTTAGQDEAIKATANNAAWGTATIYAAERGLTVPMRSSVVRGILRVGEKGGTVATLLLTIKEETEALASEIKAMNSGQCQ